ncbi:MAG: mycoredoxin [Chloroflexi bacterium]|nr:mycoredoxin [Chloroflexota bacterium]
MTDNALTVYGTTWCGDCHRARRVLDQRGVGYRWIDIDAEPGAQEVVLRLNGGLRVVPTIIFPDGSVLTEPSNRELLARLQELG